MLGWPYSSGVGLWVFSRATILSSSPLSPRSTLKRRTMAWWNDKELKALSARVVRAAPDEAMTNEMRAKVLSGRCGCNVY
eukprot:scaffold34947_cov62-Phaeocystis_antarctica.AAC.4